MELLVVLLIIGLLILEIAIIVTFFRMANDVWILRRIFEKKFGKLEEKELKENYYDPLA